MKSFAVGTAILLSAFGGSNLLTGGSAPPSLARQDRPRLADPERVRYLIELLDDRRFEVRQEADRALRQMPPAVVPLLEARLRSKPTLEATRRLEAILSDVARVPWQTDLGAAISEAGRTGKPLLIFSSDRAAADISMPIAASFADQEIACYIREHFVAVWHVQKPDPRTDRVSAFIQSELSASENQKLFWPVENARSYFCAPDGRVLHYAEGHLDVDAYRGELRHARQLAQRFTVVPDQEGFEIARSSLRIREGGASLPMHSSEQWWDAKKAIRVPELIGQPVAPVLNRLRARMVALTFGC